MRAAHQGTGGVVVIQVELDQGGGYGELRDAQLVQQTQSQVAQATQAGNGVGQEDGLVKA